MKRYKQGIDFIDFVKNFHHTLREFYSNLRNESQKEKIKLALDYLTERQEYMEHTLNSISGVLSSRVKESWFNYCEEMDACDCINSIALTSEMTIDELIDSVTKLDNCLVQIFTKLSESAGSNDVRQVFENLAKLEKNELRKEYLNFVRLADM